MLSSRRWIKTPLDIMAPYSYRFMLVRAPLESLVEVLTMWSMRVPWRCDIFFDPTDEPRVDNFKAPLDKWPEILRLGYDEFVDDSRYDANFKTYIIGVTRNPQWYILINIDSVFSGFKNELMAQSLSDGDYCAPFLNFGGIDIVRQPNTEGLDGHQSGGASDISRNSRSVGRCSLEDLSAIQSRYPIGTKGVRGLQVMGPGLVEEGQYFHEVGIFVGQNGKYKKRLDWPVNNNEFCFNGLRRILGNRGRLHDRFTDLEMANLLLEVYGLDVFNVDFYTGDIVRIESGSFSGNYKSFLADRYRDFFMPGWRGEIL